MKKLNKQKIKKENIIIPIIIILILLIAFFIYIIVEKANSKDYSIEEITNFSYFKLYENQKYGVIDSKGNILVPAVYEILEIPNPSKPVFIGYLNKNEKKTEVVNDKNEKILTNYSRSIAYNV